MSAVLLALCLAIALLLAVAALAAGNLLTAVIVLGAYSLVLSLLWAAMGAVDVAFTEATVGAGISTVLLLVALLHTSARRVAPVPVARRLGVAVAALLAAVLFWAAPDLPRFGDPASAPNRHVSPRYLEAGLAETGAPNIVTGVLGDYRGYDTLIETVVIFTAALGCWMLLSRRAG